MTGSRDAIIGNQKKNALDRFLLQLPVRLEVAKKDPLLCGVLLTIDEKTGYNERWLANQKTRFARMVA